MATYQQGVTDYITQIKPTEPNLQFDAQILQTKQSAYDANHKKISQLYGSILNSDMSRNENILARDEFFKAINTDIKKMASLDFSLDSNVNAAAKVFESIYNNQNIVKDMVWTKDFKQKYTKFENLKNCLDPEKCGGKWWEGGSKYMQYKMDEFKKATNDEALGFQNVEYVPYTNVTEKAMKYFKDNKLGIKTQNLVGNYMVTTTNGEQAIQPLTELFGSVFGSDPNVLKQYEMMAYVNRKDTVNGIMAETGLDENSATAEYLNRVGSAQQQQIDTLLNHANSDEEYIKTRMEVLEKKLKTNKFGPNSAVAKEYQKLQALLPSAQMSSQYFNSAKQVAENATNNGVVKNIASAYDQRAAAILMNQEIGNAAKSIAMTTMEQTAEADDFAKMRVQHSYSVALENLRHSHALALEAKKAELEKEEVEYDIFGNPVGKKQDPILSQTVSGYITDTYKKTKDPKEILGGYEAKIVEIKKEMEQLKKQPEDTKKLQQKLEFYKSINQEAIVRKTAEYLDKMGVQNKMGVSFSDLNKKDRSLTGRTSNDWKKVNYTNIENFNSKAHSKTIGTIYPLMVKDYAAANTNEPEVKANDITKTDPTAFNNTIKLIKDTITLSPEQEKFYERVSKPEYKLTQKDKELIANRLNVLQKAPDAKITPTNKPIVTADTVTADTIKYVAENHADESVKEKYKKLAEKKDLTHEEKVNIAKRYNKLVKTKNNLDLTGQYSTSNEKAQTVYKQLYSHLFTDLGKSAEIINKEFLTKHLTDGNKAKTKEFIKKYLKQYGVAKGSFNIIYKNKVYDLLTVSDKDIEDFKGNHNFAKQYYEGLVKSYLLKNVEPEDISNDVKLNMDNYDDKKEDFKSVYNLKKDSHDVIVQKTKANLDEDYQQYFTDKVFNNGFLVSYDQFKKIKNIYDSDNAKEVYDAYREAYIDATDAVLTEKQGAVKKYAKQTGLGATAMPIFETENVIPTVDSDASKAMFSYIYNWKQSAAEDRKILYKNKSGFLKDLSEDKSELQRVLGQFKRSNDPMHLRYQANGINSDKTDFYNEGTVGSLTWEGLRLIADDGSELFLANNPKKNPSLLYQERVIPLKQRLLLATGESKIYKGDEFTNNLPIFAYLDKNGEINLKGKIHVDGVDEDINTFRRKEGENQELFFTDVLQAEKYVLDLIEDIKKY